MRKVDIQKYKKVYEQVLTDFLDFTLTDDEYVDRFWDAEIDIENDELDGEMLFDVIRGFIHFNCNQEGKYFYLGQGDWQVAAGIEKIVFIPGEGFPTEISNYVLKVRTNHEASRTGLDEPFVYQAAEEEELEGFFAWVSDFFELELDTVKGKFYIDVYLMQYVEDVDWENETYLTGEMKNSADGTGTLLLDEWSNFSGGEEIGPGGWAQSYSLEEIEDFFGFLYRTGVNDLHEYNLGYTMTGELVLRDYSGY